MSALPSKNTEYITKMKNVIKIKLMLTFLILTINLKNKG